MPWAIMQRPNRHSSNSKRPTRMHRLLICNSSKQISSNRRPSEPCQCLTVGWCSDSSHSPLAQFETLIDNPDVIVP